MKTQFADAVDISKRAMEEYAKIHLKNAHEYQKKVFERKHGSETKRHPWFRIGDWVDIRGLNKPKLRPRTVGPYKIIHWKEKNEKMAEL